MRVDFVNGYDEFDGSVWFFDGKYVGHDDQIDAADFAPPGGSVTIEFFHRRFRDGVDYDEIDLGVLSLAELEPVLVPAPNPLQ